MVWFRAILVWVLIIAVEFVHGMIRTLIITPAIGDLRARQVGVAIGSLLILIVAVLCVRWIRTNRPSVLVAVGLIWVIFTVGFEILLGRWVLDLPWSRIRADYDISNGGFMILGLCVMAMSPLLAHAIRENRTGRAHRSSDLAKNERRVAAAEAE
jgi:hypothetical protein